MNKYKRKEIFSRLREKNPNPTTELNYSNSFELLIAVILSAQATDIGVNKATKVLFKDANTPESITKLGTKKLKEYIKSIGLFNTKARNIVNTCHYLIEQYDSKVPKKREDLEGLPGVGRKTANVILNTAFGKPTIAVDTHIFRIANRTGLAKGKTPLEVEKKLTKLTPKKYLKNAHHWLLLHGRYVCKARKPDCLNCIINELCEYKKKLEV